MSFIDSVKKKLLGDDSPVQMAPKGGRKIGSMGKAYVGGGGYVKTDKGVGFDASTYSDAKPKGKVAKMNEFNPNRTGATKAGSKGLFGQAADYIAPKAKAAGKWMQDRGMELNGDAPSKNPSPYKKGSKADKQFMTGYNRGMEAQGKPYKKTPSRLPRGSQPAGYDGNFDMFGVGGFGGGFGGGYDSEEYEEAPRRKKKSRRRAEPREREESGGFDMNHVPDSLRGMF